MGRILYIVYLWLFFVPVFLVLTILTAVTVIIGCLLGGEKIFAYYPGMIWSRLTCFGGGALSSKRGFRGCFSGRFAYVWRENDPFQERGLSNGSGSAFAYYSDHLKRAVWCLADRVVECPSSSDGDGDPSGGFYREYRHFPQRNASVRWSDSRNHSICLVGRI